MKILFTGGKTGGHIIPLINLIKELNTTNIMYLGINNGLEEKLCKKNYINFKGFKLNKKSDYIKSYFTVKKELEEFDPDIIISSGGFVSFLPLLYAKLHSLKYYLIEENRCMGRTNKIFSRGAKRVFLSFPLDKMKKNYSLKGSLSYSRKITTNKFNLDKTYINILVVGGSLGSAVMCDIAYKLTLELSNKYRIYLIAGNYYEKIYNEATNNFIIYEYVDELKELISKCDCVISRGGSSTIFETLAFEKKLIIIPSRTVKKDHQYKNAKYISDKRLGYLFNENESIKKLLTYIVKKDYIFYKDPILNKNAIIDIKEMIING